METQEANNKISQNIKEVEKNKTDIQAQNEIQIDYNFISKEEVEKFIQKIKNKEKVELDDFNLYKKIHIDNQISPLMIFILENAIEKYNNNSIDNGIEKVGFEKFPGITNKREGNNEAYFDSKEAFVLYESFPENFIANFWSNHQLLSELLGINPVKAVLSTKLKLAKTTDSASSRNVSCDSKSAKKSNNSNSQKANSFQNEEEIINESNNKEYYKLSLGANFEYNALHFLLYGIKKYINFPRIIFYPVVKYLDYEEIDSAILIEEMKTDLGAYYKNFKSIDLKNPYGERNNFNLKKDDLIFVETTFELDTKKNKIYDFMVKICAFIKLYENIGLLKSLNEYTIKPIVLYNNNYYLTKENIKDIENSIQQIKETIPKLENSKKLEEIYHNLQIIYCWPTIPLFNNFTTYNELNKKIEEGDKKLEETNKKLEDTNKKFEDGQKEIKNLKEIILNFENSLKIGNKNNYNYRYKRFNNNNYHKNYIIIL